MSLRLFSRAPRTSMCRGKTHARFKQHSQAVPQENSREKAEASSLFAFMYLRSSARWRLALQFDLIVINSGTDEIF